MTDRAHDDRLPRLFDELQRLKAAEPAHNGRADGSAQTAADAYFGPDDLLDDEPMPIPSTWHDGRDRDGDRATTVSEEMHAALLGFAIGLLIVVPIVLAVTGRLETVITATRHATDQFITASVDWAGIDWTNGVGGFADPGQSPATGSGSATLAPSDNLRPADADTLKMPEPLPEPEAELAGLLTRRMVSAESYGTSTRTVSANTAASAPNRRSAEAALMESKALIAAGDVLSARNVLQAARTNTSGPILFALAETYDPNVLKSWGVADTSPDSETARGLYMLALMAGMSEAKARVDALD